MIWCVLYLSNSESYLCKLVKVVTDCRELIYPRLLQIPPNGCSHLPNSFITRNKAGSISMGQLWPLLPMAIVTIDYVSPPIWSLKKRLDLRNAASDTWKYMQTEFCFVFFGHSFVFLRIGGHKWEYCIFGDLFTSGYIIICFEQNKCCY